MAFFSKPKYSSITAEKKKEIPDNLHEVCPISKVTYYKKKLEELNYVSHAGYHFRLPAPLRIAQLIDPGTFQEMDTTLQPTDPLDFSRFDKYLSRLQNDQKKTGLDDAVISGLGKMDGIEVSIAVMEFAFRGGSMGSVVGEKITRAVERATEKKLPVIIVSASGGARMQEGILSLMQMAKTSAALARHHEAGGFYISILTHPTFGGVTASFAVLGDLNLAEPGASIGFAGARVIKEGTNQILPEGFQTAEFLLKRGLIDQIVHRNEMKKRIVEFLHVFYLRKKPVKS